MILFTDYYISHFRVLDQTAWLRDTSFSERS